MMGTGTVNTFYGGSSSGTCYTAETQILNLAAQPLLWVALKVRCLRVQQDENALVTSKLRTSESRKYGPRKEDCISECTKARTLFK